VGFSRAKPLKQKVSVKLFQRLVGSRGKAPVGFSRAKPLKQKVSVKLFKRLDLDFDFWKNIQEVSIL